MEDTQEAAIDYVESKLMERIDSGAERSIIFYLKTRGRRRGFQESGNSENEMITRDMMTMMTNAYSGRSSRFDRLLEEPNVDDYFPDEEGA